MYYGILKKNVFRHCTFMESVLVYLDSYVIYVEYINMYQ